MTLTEVHAVHAWLTQHGGHALEKSLWDAVVMMWLMGWAGVPAALLLDIAWAQLVGVGALFLPGAYVAWRARLHRLRRLRCDWICAVRPQAGATR